MATGQDRVTVHSGCSYSDVPLEFFTGRERHLVRRVVTSRLEERRGPGGMTRKVWLVEDDGNRLYTLTYHMMSDLWEITPGGD